MPKSGDHRRDTAFAEGEYTVVLDGHFFPEAIDELAGLFAARATPLHYAVPRADCRRA